jgi:hypothetical protein
LRASPSARVQLAGLKVFNTGKGESVVSVAWIADQGDEEESSDETAPGGDTAAPE